MECCAALAMTMFFDHTPEQLARLSSPNLIHSCKIADAAPPSARPLAAESDRNQSACAVCAAVVLPPAPPVPAPPSRAAAAQSLSPTSDTPGAECAPPAVMPSAARPSLAAPKLPALARHTRPLDMRQHAPASQTGPAKSAHPSCPLNAHQTAPQARAARAALPETAPPTVRIFRRFRPTVDTATSSTTGPTIHARPNRPPHRAMRGAPRAGSDTGTRVRLTAYLTKDTLVGITQDKSHCPAPGLERLRPLRPASRARRLISDRII